MKIYLFYPEHGDYDDAIIYLAEGLRELGIPFFSNRTIWRTGESSTDFLIQQNPDVNYFDCDLVVFSAYWFHYITQDTFQNRFSELPQGFLQHRKKFHAVLIDQFDGYKTISWKYHHHFDIVLRTKFNKNTHHPNNYKPWVLGFTSRIVRATQSRKDYDQRTQEVLVNFNYSHPYEHPLRRLAKEKIIPKLSKKTPINYAVTGSPELDTEFDKLMFHQTEGKHNPDYYRLLGSSSMIASFCGDLIPSVPYNPSEYLVGGKKARIKKYIYSCLSLFSGLQPRIIQWDSWRFWEALVAGCIPIHLDLEKYGVLLPEMPLNWIHYIGIDLDHIDRDVERIAEDKETLKNLAVHGRQWVTQFYAPKESAKRLLNIFT